MITINKVQLTGNLTKDVELKDTAKSKVGKFTIAQTRRYKAADGMKEETSFVTCEIWGARAAALAKHAQKGTAIYIEGRIKQERWETGENDKHSRLVVVAEDWQFAMPKKNGADAPEEEAATAGASAG